MNELDAIRARAEAYALHGTPGLHAPQDRAYLLKALDAVTLAVSSGLHDELCSFPDRSGIVDCTCWKSEITEALGSVA